MADSSPFNRDPKKTGLPSRPSPAALPGNDMKISCRATNPLSLDDDLGKVFLDEQQAKATTATRLFRNDELFHAMTRVILPAFFKNNRSGKFCMWSTGCSSGEEIYSMAMIALAEFQKAGRPPLLEACGTDINRNRILEARQGTYIRPSRDAFSAQYWRLLNLHAELDDHQVQMSETIRAACKFSLFDMRKRPKNHTFHFIVCNHVLQYYDAPGQKHIIGNLKAVLRPGGFLYLEGVTDSGLDGARLKKYGGTNLYVVEGGGAPGSPFKK